MRNLERAILLGAIAYMVLYLPYFFVQVYRIEHGVKVPLAAILVPHLFGMVLNFLALIVTIRDLYLRSFPSPNAKLIWALLILCTCGFGWFFYVFKYALKARPADQQLRQ